MTLPLNDLSECVVCGLTKGATEREGESMKICSKCGEVCISTKPGCD